LPSAGVAAFTYPVQKMAFRTENQIMVRQVKKLRKALNCFNDDSLWSECGIEEKTTLKNVSKKLNLEKIILEQHTYVEKVKGKENTNHFRKLNKIQRSEIYSKE
jgi:hypothetical protein